MKRKRLYFFILLITCLAAAFYQLINSTNIQVFGEIVPKVKCDDKVVALTFDDGPTSRIRPVLEILKSNNIKATFFVVGKNLDENPEYGVEIVKAGHQLGNHTYHHNRMIFKSPGYIESEIERTDELIRKAGFKEEIYFRPPYGKKFLLLPYYLKQQNIKTITWNIAPENFDDVSISAQQITELINQQIEPGSIILLHPMIEANSSLQAIPLIIRSLKSKGYKFLTVSQLMHYCK